MKQHKLALFSAVTAFAALLLCSGCFSNKLTDEEVNSILSLDSVCEPSDISAEQLAKQMYKATDPKGKFKDSSTFLLRQRVIDRETAVEISKTGQKQKKIKHDEGESELKFRAPDSLMQTTSKNGVANSQLLIKDGRAWDINPKKKTATEITGHRLELTKMFNMMTQPSKTFLDVFPNPEISCVYIGKTRHYRIVCRADNPQIAPYVMYVNAQTFLTTKMETILYSDDGEIQLLYSAVPRDFKLYEGVVMPSVTIITVGDKEDISEIIDFEMDVKFDDSEFELPKKFSITDSYDE